MHVHHINCSSMCALGQKTFPQLFPTELAIHCLIIETARGLVLVDTGFGVENTKDPSRLGLMRHVLGVQSLPSTTAFEQVKKLGHDPRDVSDIIVTHLDSDHAGGIYDFPNAKIHVHESELKAALEKKSFRLKQRYRDFRYLPEAKWQAFTGSSDQTWKGFEQAQSLEGLPQEILAVRLPGHTPGHIGVAVKDAGGWLFHCGDAYYDRREILDEKPPAAIRLMHHTINADLSTTRKTQRKLGQLTLDSSVRMFCSHDWMEFHEAATLKKAASEV